MTTSAPSAEKPWSHRQSLGIRLLICALAGAGTAIVGTLMHRMGASLNIPYGLVLAFALVLLSAWAARLRSGVIGVAFHLIVCSALVWMFAMYGPGGDVLIAVGFGGSVPFFSQYVGYMWLYGVIIVHLLVVAMPHSWVYGSRKRSVGAIESNTSSVSVEAVNSPDAVISPGVANSPIVPNPSNSSIVPNSSNSFAEPNLSTAPNPFVTVNPFASTKPDDLDPPSNAKSPEVLP